MNNIIHFPIIKTLQPAFIQLDEDGYHYLHVRHMIDRRAEIHFQTPDDECTYGSTLARMTSLDQPNPDVIDANTNQPLFRYRIGIIGAINIGRLFIGMALVGTDVQLAQAAPHKIAAHNESGVFVLSLGLSELGLHLRSHNNDVHFVYRIKTFDSFAK